VPKLLCFIVALTLSFSAHVLAGEQWPKLDRKSTDFVCLETIKYAQAAFNSTNLNLFEPITNTEGGLSTIIAQAAGKDISGGDEIASDPSFERLELKDEKGLQPPNDFYHWAKEDTGGWRFVIVSESGGWRGNMYTLYRIESKLTQSQFVEALSNSDDNDLPQPSIVRSWRPPMIIARRDNRKAWAVDVGQSFQVLAPWRVYGANGSKPEPACQVEFAKPFQKVEDLLPAPVANLAMSLDMALGEDGPTSGTLKPIAHTRIFAKAMWGNIAARPWAIPGQVPFNDRADVDSNLKKWGQDGANAALLKKIEKQYPLAEKALANYYKENFSKSSAEANEMAAKYLDLVYRSHFVFGSDGLN
jgi:hypothetical protein